ncbi:peptidyl-tRNA hydrolase [Rubidibacter lacunae KORDI 51-2]|uniref:Peptidyl-tRNA hydrolase n=1 Tax=Rubidibacter lacunae KORDI 51-2 TaxID=582515 RepID=U5D6A8_9CHRO|nr:aminoacyl-tRNA hydrolase [Rubidibacter lacunae]ERN40173.1 peptidyl-tRNA hydrolase [Rubidibacter lacunae KORDI 51-2]
MPDPLIPQLLVGLGNPGDRYAHTRHNIGFDVVDRLAIAWQLPWQENRRFKGQYAEGAAPGLGKVRLLKPTTYMNRSGESVRAVCDWYKLPPESVLAIYDEMDLPVGRLRLRLSGSAGGHNGIKSLISHLGTQSFPRLRIGIGKSDGKRETIGHVLGCFAPNEKDAIVQVLDLAVEATELSLRSGVEQAMNRYNGCAVAVEP